MYGHDTASETFQQLDKTRENFKLGLFMLWHSCIIEIERLQFFRKHCSPFYFIIYTFKKLKDQIVMCICSYILCVL